MPYIVRETNARGHYLYLHRRLGGGFFTSQTRVGAYRYKNKDDAIIDAVKHYGPFSVAGLTILRVS